MFRKLALIAAGIALLGFGLSAAPASAQQPTPSISITKTVTTEPDVCGTSSSIQVETGTTVYYCYSITNTGDIMLNLHNLVDDQLGTILEDFQFELDPDASVNTVAAGLSIDAVITETTTNVAIWEACREYEVIEEPSPQGADIPCADATATAMVTVVAAPTTTTTTEAAPAVAAAGTPRFTG